MSIPSEWLTSPNWPLHLSRWQKAQFSLSHPNQYKNVRTNGNTLCYAKGEVSDISHTNKFSANISFQSWHRVKMSRLDPNTWRHYSKRFSFFRPRSQPGFVLTLLKKGHSAKNIEASAKDITVRQSFAVSFFYAVAYYRDSLGLFFY